MSTPSQVPTNSLYFGSVLSLPLPKGKIQRFQPPKQLGNLGNQRNFLENIPIDIKMLICNAFLPFYSFAKTIIKIHFFMNEIRNHSNLLSRSFPPWSYYLKATLLLLFPFCLFCWKVARVGNPTWKCFHSFGIGLGS